MSETALKLRLLFIATLLTTLTLNLRLAPMAHAATITVNGTADTVANDGQCTLREAITAASNDTAVNECAAGSGDDTIDLTGITGTINLTGSLPDITSNVVFNGPGADNLTVRRDTGGNYRIFRVGSGAAVTISGLTISNGSVVNDFGGGIYNSGTLMLNDSTVSNNSTNTSFALGGHGGGIYNTGILTLTNSTVSSNSITTTANNSYGGGIYNSGTMTLTYSTVSNNTTDGYHCDGGGIHNEGALTLNNSTVISNIASVNSIGDGGGIHNIPNGSVTLNNSTVSDNLSNGGGSGGGIMNRDGAIMVLTNSTISGNITTNNGGGIDNTYGSTMILNNSTVSHNSAYGSGGGIENNFGGMVNFKNSIIAGNTASYYSPDCYNTATFTSEDYNLVGDNSDCPFTLQTNDQVNVDPLLGSLGDNGGPTETHALLTGSPAIDAIPGGNCTDHLGMPIATDQRGVPRPQGATAHCDSGAYEVAQNADLSLSKTVDEANPIEGETVAFIIQVTNNGPLGATGVVISDLLPLGLTFASANTSQGSYTSGTGEWNVGSLTVGLSATLTVTVTVDAGTVGTTITNTATITAADQFDPDANNTDVAAVTVGMPMSNVYLPLVMKAHCGCGPDNYEPNDSCGQAYHLEESGRTYESYISCCDAATYKKSDYFYINISTTNPINIYLTNIPAGTDYDLYLYRNPGDDPTNPAAESIGYGSSETISYAPTATGTYYIRVHAFSGYSASPYSLRVTYDPPLP